MKRTARRSFFKIGIGGLLCAAAGWIGGFFKPVMAQEKPKGRPWPTKEKMEKSPVYHVSPVYAKEGEEEAVLAELKATADGVKGKEGVNAVGLYQKVHGDGPSHLGVMVADNPGVVKRLTKDEKFDDSMKKIGEKSRRKSAVAGKSGIVDFSSSLVHRTQE